MRAFEFDKAGNKGYGYRKISKDTIREESEHAREHSPSDFLYRLYCGRYLCSVADGSQQ